VPYRLRSRPKNYDWGAPGALSRFLGLEDSSEPEAEVWWGDHPLSECSLISETGEENFSSWLAHTGQSFPLLVKILAAEKPLSIQVHPSDEQAVRGFLQEEAAGIPLSAPKRTYKDQSAKPELLIALSDDFVALAGFAPERVVAERIERWVAEGAPSALKELFGPIAGSPRESAKRIVTPGETISKLVEQLGEWVDSWTSENKVDPISRDREILAGIRRAHPGDPGVLFALVMNQVALRRGEALFVDAGEVHAYLWGTGLEVMLPSDNVIRAGLTTKHKDHEALMALAVFDASENPTLVSPTFRGSLATYENFGAAFAVREVRAGATEIGVEKPAVCVVERGSVEFRTPTGPVAFHSGEVVFAVPGESLSAASEDCVVWVVQAESS
jgi:mannose-6-phosphate isomerase